MSPKTNTLIKQVYSPTLSLVGNFSPYKWFGTKTVRYYSLARHALVAALCLLGLKKGDEVALPEFICRDLLASLTIAGVSVVFYSVDQYLRPACKPEKFSNCKVIIVVNYFGFPQDLTFFTEIVNSTNALLIEDNAHGFLSCDENGIPLGTRTPIGLFSFRKILPLYNGAALVVNDKEWGKLLPDQIPCDYINNSALDYKIKKLMRGLVPIMGIQPCRIFTCLVRGGRRIFTGTAIPQAGTHAEKRIPLEPEPYDSLYKELAVINVSAEVSRRRNLYLLLDREIQKYGGIPVFDKLLEGVSPYTYPFRADDGKIERIRKFLKTLNLECHRWPDLPTSVLSTAKRHYLNVWMVPFLW